MRTLLIDGDILVVSTGAAIETEVDWGNDEWTIHCDVKEVKKSILETIEKLKASLDADAAVVTLSKGTTFRHDLSDTYKAGRGRKPVGTGAVKDWLIEEHGAKYIPNIEADDIMGILATNPRIVKGEKVIVSADKDMKTIPGLLYQEGKLQTITPEAARKNWLIQTLSGDVVDGYPGCPGVGAKTAQEALDTMTGWEEYAHVKENKKSGEVTTTMKWRKVPMESDWDVVVSLYKKAGKTVEDAILQAQLARILHSDDYNFKTKEPILWHPAK